jgi:hypothetical protein
MHLRRTIALATGALALSALTSCGFDYATDRPYTPANGVNHQGADVDVLGAVIVSAEEGSGTFVATLVNNDSENPTTFEGLEPVEAGALEFDAVEPVEIAPGGLVNLAEDGGVGVTGEFAAGDFVEMIVQVGAEPIEMNVVVVTNCGDFAGLAGPEDPEQCEAPEPAVEH